MSVLSLLSTGLMIIVVLIALGSLIIVATIPLGRWVQNRRDKKAAASSR